ncbi:MAG TPA: LLM class flavin-dependent oxidoreductase [Nocardioidaceae bacterium]|jgi:alkanesulfonate monooxygenase SsuD/methylene tetrahydromethanopterin reductase-like flavin-dependent oxidoreductase (luciferase family)
MQILGRALAFDPAREAIAAEAAGYDGVRVIDHFFSGIAPEPQRATSHSIAGLAAAAAVTERVLLTSTMLSAPIRHPLECAQAIATIDRISAGRAELGIGGGWNRAEFAAIGVELGTPRDRVARLVEATTICRQAFEHKGVVHFDGRFFHAHCDAEWPATPHVPEVMVAAGGPGTIRRAAPVANRLDLLESMPEGRPVLDATHVNSEEHLVDRIALAREVAGRAGNDIKLSATVMLSITPDAVTRDRSREQMAEIAQSTPDLLDRELLRVIDTGEGAFGRIRTLAAIGFDRLHIRPADEPTQRWLDAGLADLQRLPTPG